MIGSTLAYVTGGQALLNTLTWIVTGDTPFPMNLALMALLWATSILAWREWRERVKDSLDRIVDGS
jgi:hypothetical protein